MTYTIYQEKSDDGQLVSIYEKDDRKIALNSLYSPEREVERFLTKLEEMKNHLIFIIGFGNGALLDGISKSELYKKNVHFIFIEPFSEVDISESSSHLLKDYNKFSLYYAKDFDSLIFTSYIVKYMSIPISLQIHPNYSKINDEAITNCLKIIQDGIETVQVFKNTQARFATDWIIEPLLNSRVLPRSFNIKKYLNKFKGEKAILVASGPSLKGHMDFLKENGNGFHIFCVGSALRALLANNIQPDYVVSMDAGKINYDTHFEGLNYEGTLIYETVSNSDIQSNHRGPLIVSRTVADQVTPQFCNDLYSFSQASPSVAVLALQVISYFGFSDIYLVGQDLALADGEYYAAGIKHHEEVKTYKEDILITNNQGKQVGTTRTLKIFLETFETLIKSFPKDVNIYNLSEYGAKIEGTKFIKESEIIKPLKSNIDITKEVVLTSSNPELIISEFIEQLNSLNKEVTVARKGTLRLISLRMANSNDVTKVLKDFRKVSKHSILEKVILSNLKFLFNSIINKIQLQSIEKNYTSKMYLEFINEIDNFYLVVQAYCEKILDDERLIMYK